MTSFCFTPLEDVVRLGEHSHVKDYRVVLKIDEKVLFTVAEFMQTVIATFPRARGSFRVLENQTQPFLYLCASAKDPSAHQMGELYPAFPMPPEYLDRRILKIEANGYGLYSDAPVTNYHLLLEPTFPYWERADGQMSLFRV